ncbi:hypothetical protein [Actinoplanes sp. NPDC049265]|uniref:hypothetical protein n=1 Tax=Actinoplanes sp. NPDC049265 TaxID=3363902 RepID=UPI0037226771
MANTFSVDPWLAGQIARELGEIRTELSSPPLSSASDVLVAGSEKIATAMHEFFSDSTESRTRMGNLIERAAGLLGQLSEGTLEVDRSLAAAFEEGAR